VKRYRSVMTSDDEDADLSRSIGIALPFGVLAGVVVGILIDNIGLGVGVGLPASIAVAGLLHERRRGKPSDR
jgi:hypothetical protein